MNDNNRNYLGCLPFIICLVILFLLFLALGGGELFVILFKNPGIIVVGLFLVGGFLLGLPYTAIGVFRWFWRK